MPERASIFQTAQWGVETTPGTGVAANKKLTAVGLALTPQVETTKTRAAGNKFASLVTPGKEWASFKINGQLTYTEIVYLLSGLMSYAAPVQQGATAAYKWTHTIDTDGPDTVKTYTIEQGSSVRAHSAAYGQVKGLELMFDRSKCEISGGEMIAKAISDGITMTSSPTEIALVPVLPTQVDIYLADTYAGLAGASALARAISVSWGLNNRFGALFPLGTASGTGFAATVETEPELTCKLKMQADAEGMGLLTTLRAGATKFLRIKAVGALIASTYYYTLQIDSALKVENVGELADSDGVYAIEWSMTGVHDATWGKATQIEVTNTLTAL